MTQIVARIRNATGDGTLNQRTATTMASTQSATSIDSAQVSWIESVGQAFSNVSDAFSSARAPASMAHCRAAFTPDILLRYSSTRETISFGSNMTATETSFTCNAWWSGHEKSVLVRLEGHDAADKIAYVIRA